jgi:hypothetical protein
MSISTLQQLELQSSHLHENLLENAKVIKEELPLDGVSKIKLKIKNKVKEDYEPEGIKDLKGENQGERKTGILPKEERVGSEKIVKIFENPLYKLSHKDRLNDEFSMSYEALKNINQEKILHSDKPDLNSHSLIYDIEIPKKYQMAINYKSTLSSMRGRHVDSYLKNDRKASLGNVTGELSPGISQLYKKLEANTTTSNYHPGDDILNSSLIERSSNISKFDMPNETSRFEKLNKSVMPRNLKDDEEYVLPSLMKSNNTSSNIHIEKHRRIKTHDSLLPPNKTKKSKKMSKLTKELQHFIVVKNINSKN